MKKLLSLVCVLALALAICVPAFAEDATSGQATPGQVADSLANYVAEHPEDYAAAKSLNDTLKANPSVYVDSKTTKAMLAAILKAENAVEYEWDGTVNDWMCYTVNPDTTNVSLYGEVSAPSGNSFTLTASWEPSTYQSELGAFVLVRVPVSSMALANDYMWRNDSGQYGYVEAYLDEEDPDNIYFAFFAPHFSTYTIYRAPAPGSNDSGSVLARTNADLNMTAALLAILALATTAGCAVVLKKRALGK